MSGGGSLVLVPMRRTRSPSRRWTSAALTVFLLTTPQTPSPCLFRSRQQPTAFSGIFIRGADHGSRYVHGITFPPFPSPVRCNSFLSHSDAGGAAQWFPASRSASVLSLLPLRAGCSFLSTFFCSPSPVRHRVPGKTLFDHGRLILSRWTRSDVFTSGTFFPSQLESIGTCSPFLFYHPAVTHNALVGHARPYLPALMLSCADLLRRLFPPPPLGRSSLFFSSCLIQSGQLFDTPGPRLTKKSRLSPFAASFCGPVPRGMILFPDLSGLGQRRIPVFLAFSP